MKSLINRLDDFDFGWPAIIFLIVLLLVISFAAYALIWYIITLLLGISFAWNHAAVFYIVCAAVGGFNYSSK